MVLTAGKRSDFFPAEFLYADLGLRPGALALSVIGAFFSGELGCGCVISAVGKRSDFYFGDFLNPSVGLHLLGRMGLRSLSRSALQALVSAACPIGQKIGDFVQAAFRVMIVLRPQNLYCALNHVPQLALCKDRIYPTDCSCLAAGWGTDVR